MQTENKKGRFLNFYKTYDNGKLELMISVHIDYVLMAWKPEILKNIKEKINLKFNIK